MLFDLRKGLLFVLTVCLAAVNSGCSQVADKLPDSYYETDDVSVSASAYETEITQAAETSAARTVSAETSLTETVSVTESESVTVTAATELVSEIQSTEPESTAPTVEIIESEEGEYAEFVPAETSETTAVQTESAQTEPSETEASSETTAPSVTIVTFPKPIETETTVVTRPSVSFSDSSSTNYYALNFDRQKAVWISYLEYDRIMRDCSEEKFTEEIGRCFDNISKIGCNTVYFQTRAYGDAYYRSSIFPKADRLTGEYDPLEIAVKEAHDRGLSIHAWINPMRLMTDSGMKEVPSDYKIRQWYDDDATNGTYIVNSSGRWYLNPAYSETVSLICDGVREILTGYDVDGIQIDDYFYPTTDKSFDAAAYAASGTSLDLADWRRETVTSMVKCIYTAVHSANPTAVFGISPQGNINSDYNDLYADIYTWLSSEGCCDYICPQIYYGFDNGTLPYAETVSVWDSLIKNDVRLVIGLAAYKSGTEDKYAGDGKYEWQKNTDILSRQRSITDIYDAGYAYFRYDSIFLPDPAVSAYVSSELDNLMKTQ